MGNPAAAFALRLLLRLVLRLPALALLLSLLVCSAPGIDADERQLDLRRTAASLEQLQDEAREKREPLLMWWRFVSGAVHGDFGYSESFARPVGELLRERVPVTLRAAGAGLLLGWTASCLPGLWAAAGGRRVFQVPFQALAGLLLCVPAALLGFLMVLGGLPAGLAIGGVVFARVYPYLQRILGQILTQPYVASAHGQGVTPARVAWRHVLPVAGPQIAPVLAGSVTAALGAAVPVEVISDLPGLGQLAWRATLGRDLPVLLSVTMLLAALSIAASSWSDGQRQKTVEAA